jgi:hypothetical protein
MKEQKFFELMFKSPKQIAALQKQKVSDASINHLPIILLSTKTISFPFAKYPLQYGFSSQKDGGTNQNDHGRENEKTNKEGSGKQGQSALNWVKWGAGVVAVAVLEEFARKALWPSLEISIRSDSVLSNLPGQNIFYISDEKFLKNVKDNLDSKKVVAITGFGGVGKTTFAIEYGHYAKNQMEYNVEFFNVASTGMDESYRSVAKDLRI